MNESLTPFSNLASAGAELAAKFSRAGMADDIVVLAMVSAGVPAAVEVAKHLDAPLDLIIVRRLLAPHGPGSQATAVNVAGTLVVDEEIGPLPPNRQSPFDYFVEDALNGLALRTQICRGERPTIDLAGKEVLIVDCGIRTGLTMKAAICAVRTLDPSSITAAVPVTSSDGLRVVEELADKCIYLAAPEPFGNAGVWYKDFRRQADEAISELLRNNPKPANAEAMPCA
jgi:putative phosphoribosyl transferase